MPISANNLDTIKGYIRDVEKNATNRYKNASTTPVTQEHVNTLNEGLNTILSSGIYASASPEQKAQLKPLIDNVKSSIEVLQKLVTPATAGQRRSKTSSVRRRGGNPVKKHSKTAKKYVEPSRARRFLIAGKRRKTHRR